jgi:hypothetical protein
LPIASSSTSWPGGIGNSMRINRHIHVRFVGNRRSAFALHVGGNQAAPMFICWSDCCPGRTSRFESLPACSRSGLPVIFMFLQFALFRKPCEFGS